MNPDGWEWKMFAESHPEEDGASVWRVSPDGRSRQSVAWHMVDEDARLAAAAPDLLAALKAHLPWREEPAQGWGMWADAVAAIAKAEGRTDDQV